MDDHRHDPFPLDLLTDVVDRWHAAMAAGECCSPSPLDVALEDEAARSVAWLERLRTFGIDVAFVASDQLRRLEREGEDAHP